MEKTVNQIIEALVITEETSTEDESMMMYDTEKGIWVSADSYKL